MREITASGFDFVNAAAAPASLCCRQARLLCQCSLLMFQSACRCPAAGQLPHAFYITPEPTHPKAKARGKKRGAARPAGAVVAYHSFVLQQCISSGCMAAAVMGCLCGR